MLKKIDGIVFNLDNVIAIHPSLLSTNKYVVTVITTSAYQTGKFASLDGQTQFNTKEQCQNVIDLLLNT